MGPVAKTCEQAFIDEYSGNYAGAAVAIVTAITLLVGAIGAFPLFTGFNKEE